MEKVYGSPVRQDGLYKIGRNKWELVYGFGKDNPEDETGWNYRQRFTHKPTLEEIKEAVLGAINAETDAKILRGFEWDGKRVWLSIENQINFLSAADRGAAPLRMKLGEDEDGLPSYHTFDTAAELRAFASACSAYSQACLIAGWEEKDGIDWGIFAQSKS